MAIKDLYRPETVDEAVTLLNENGRRARVLAGGTDLLGTIREKIHPDDVEEIISLKDIGDIKAIKDGDDYLEIGSMVTLSEIGNSPLLRSEFPLIADAANTVASPQIRHMATIGGNICQEPRCWYYRYQDDRFNCLRKGGDRCNAVVGNNLYHSVFGPSRVCETPCEVNCPNHTNIPGYMEMIRRGDVDGAAGLLFQVNPMAAVTGRICPHTCEQHCNRRKYDESVSIREVERYLGDYILGNSDRFFKAPDRETGKKVAIVGAGPAGLTAAYYLRTAGHDVTIYDSNEHVGGMLYYGIPSYRLPKETLDDIRKILEGIGVELRMGTRIGEDMTMDELSSGADALFVGIGAWVSLNLDFAGRDAKGIINALQFLYDIAERREQKIGKKVVVIGGGNTSFDVCRSALKMGAEEVTLLSILPYDEMPAEEEEITEAEREGVVIRELTTLKEVVKKEDGTIDHLVYQMMKKRDEDAEGLENIIADGDNTTTDTADNIVIAIGQGIDMAGFDRLQEESPGIDLKDPDAGRTVVEDVFAAGDAAHGPATVVKSIFQARTTAKAISDSITNATDETSSFARDGISFSENALQNSERVKPEELPLEERSLYDEITKTINELGFSEEAERCLNCGCVAVTPSDVGTALMAVDATVVTDRRQIPIDEFFGTPVGGSTVLEDDEIVTSIRIPKGRCGNRQIYFKHRTRKSIDFPITSVAINADVKGGVANHIHISLGAVAPTPRRAYAAEDSLKGKKLSKEIINEASETAVEDCMALAENRYKIDLLKVLIRRNLEKLLEE